VVPAADEHEFECRVGSGCGDEFRPGLVGEVVGGVKFVDSAKGGPFSGVNPARVGWPTRTQ
jgi:hypothetical protein